MAILKQQRDYCDPEERLIPLQLKDRYCDDSAEGLSGHPEGSSGLAQGLSGHAQGSSGPAQGLSRPVEGLSRPAEGSSDDSPMMS